MMLSGGLLWYCFALGGATLVVMTFLVLGLGRVLQVRKYLSPELAETMTFGWRVMNFIMEFLFFVAVPTLAYSVFAVILPLEGVRVGLAMALVGFGLGAMPAVVGLSVRLKLPMNYLLFFLFGILLKLIACLAVIGYLYSL
jgi:hypothetical protein